jgi:hypothetical protein
MGAPTITDGEGMDPVNRLADLSPEPASEQTPAPEKPYDPFDLNAIRINQATLSGSATKLISSYAVRKPKKNITVQNRLKKRERKRPPSLVKLLV